jgi:hypothetical protein
MARPDAKPYHSRPFPVPKIHEATLKIELARMPCQGRCHKESQPKQVGSTHLSNTKKGCYGLIHFRFS